jgi:hypothetical protein
MIDIKKLVSALRLWRHLILVENNLHPLHDLIKALIQDNDYLGDKIALDIDEITKLNTSVLQNKRIEDLKLPEWQLESDLILQTNILSTSIASLTRPRKVRSREAADLRRLGIGTLFELVQNHRPQINKLKKIARTECLRIVNIIFDLDNGQMPIPMPEFNKIRDKLGHWLNPHQLTSKTIRELLYGNSKPVTPKILLMNEDTKIAFYSKIKKLTNIANKTKLLRLIHGDVYTAERRQRFGMSDTDRCRRCFEQETIIHLLQECPYSKEVFRHLNINHTELENIIGTTLSSQELEIRTELIIALAFRLQTMPPEVLVRTTLEKFAKGLSGKRLTSQLPQGLTLQLL